MKSQSKARAQSRLRSENSSSNGNVLPSRSEGPAFSTRSEGPAFSTRSEGVTLKVRSEGVTHKARPEVLTLQAIPTFHLKKIKPFDILARYKAGDFPEINGEKVNISPTNISILPKFGHDHNEETFILIDRSGSKNLYTSTNQKNYASFCQKGCLDPTSLCDWCRWTIGEKGLCLPLQIVEEKVFIGDLPYCSYECAFSGLKRNYGSSFLTRDPLYRNSEYLLRHLFQLDYPGKDLKGALDYRLLNINGGPLSREEFLSGAHYVRTVNQVIPSKVCYFLAPKH